jgi:hypothetical protein
MRKRHSRLAAQGLRSTILNSLHTISIVPLALVINHLFFFFFTKIKIPSVHLSGSFEQKCKFQESTSSKVDRPVFSRAAARETHHIPCHAELIRRRPPVILIYDSVRSVFSSHRCAASHSTSRRYVRRRRLAHAATRCKSFHLASLHNATLPCRYAVELFHAAALPIWSTAPPRYAAACDGLPGRC